jgi:hypothetical protein
VASIGTGKLLPPGMRKRRIVAAKAADESPNI